MAWIGVRSDKGNVRKINQDACCVEVAETALGEAVLAVVCDGVGGLEQGEVASATVVENFSLWFRRKFPQLVSEAAERGSLLGATAVRESWAALITSLNEAIASQANEERMGTTLSAVLCMGGRYVVAHVGDTRVYRIGQGGITQVTEDQTLVNQRLADGSITLEEASSSGEGHVIMQAVGFSETVRPSFYSGRIRDEELFVLCSDGAWHCAGEEGIQDVFEEASWHDDRSLAGACDRLVRQDMALGESDNLTVVAFCPSTPIDQPASHQGSGESSVRPANDVTLVGMASAEVDDDGEADR